MSKEVIKKFLESKRKTDKDLDKAMQKTNKNIDDCWKYIVEQAQKKKTGNCACVADDVVFGWAFHYYQEDSVSPKSKATPKVEVKTAKVTPAEELECDWDDDEETPVAKPQPKVELKTVHKAEQPKKPTHNKDNADDIFADCDW